MVNMSIGQNKNLIDDALAILPDELRLKLRDSFLGVKSAFSRGHHEITGLRAGKFCEVMIRVAQWKVKGSYIPFGVEIKNFADECRLLEKEPQLAGPESLRVVMPRALLFVYTLRNKRGIGHVGGDLDANKIDAATCARVADWCMCELIRIVHTLPIEEAQAFVDAISAREMPHVWDVGGKKRILQNDLDYKSKTLLLLYSEPENIGLPFEDLLEWTGYSNRTIYRRTVLDPLHNDRLIEYDRDNEMVIISPLGIREVEERLLPELDAQSIAVVGRS
jgi:hypothetical protein